LNASRLKLLQAQDDLVRKMKDAAEKQLRKVGSSDDENYPKLLEALIIQVRSLAGFDVSGLIQRYALSRAGNYHLHLNGCFVNEIEIVPVLKDLICGCSGFAEAEGAVNSAALS